jgi:PEP-CTERM motif
MFQMHHERTLTIVRKLFLSGAAILAFSGAAWADTITDDPLHGFCFVGQTTCADNGSITTAASFSGSDWGFWISPGPQTGLFNVVFAIPNNDPAPSSVPVSGTIQGNLVSLNVPKVGAWTGGDLATVAGITLPGGASPPNPFPNFIGFTQSVDASATGYTLYQGSFNVQTLQGQNDTTEMDLSASLPVGSMIFGFEYVNHWIATASSGVLFVDARDPVPEPSTLGVLGTGLLGLGMVSAVRRRRH